MKKGVVFLSLICSFWYVVRSCPTCFSSLSEYTPPFFSEESYQPYNEPAQTNRQKLNHASPYVETAQAEKELVHEKKVDTNSVDYRVTITHNADEQ